MMQLCVNVCHIFMSHIRLHAWSARLGKKFNGAAAVAVLADSPGYLVVVDRELDATEMRRLENVLRSLGVHTWHWSMDDGRTKVRAYVHAGSWRKLLALGVYMAIVAYIATVLARWYDVHTFAQALGIWARQRWGHGIFSIQNQSLPS
jgi:hypothetical protein